MGLAAARVAGTSIFLVATFDRAGIDDIRFLDEPTLVPRLDDGAAGLFNLIREEKSRVGIAAAAA